MVKSITTNPTDCTYVYIAHMCNVYTLKNTMKIHKYSTQTPDVTTELLHLLLYEIQWETDLLVIC